MGTCASIHKDPASAVKFRVVVGNKKVTAPSPARGPPNGGGFPNGGFDRQSARIDAAGAGLKSPGFGSKDEIFFDSRAWIDSDCEDDFFSVKGDFTPSCGSTPNYQTGTPIKPQLTRTVSFDGFPDTKSEPSPRKKLAEFFRESTEQENNLDEGKVKVNGIVKEVNMGWNPKSINGTPCPSQTDSTGSTERVSKSNTPNGKERAVKAMHCCLPNLVHSHFNERKKQAPTPEPHSGG